MNHPAAQRNGDIDSPFLARRSSLASTHGITSLSLPAVSVEILHSLNVTRNSVVKYASARSLRLPDTFEAAAEQGRDQHYQHPQDRVVALTPQLRYSREVRTLAAVEDGRDSQGSRPGSDPLYPIAAIGSARDEPN